MYSKDFDIRGGRRAASPAQRTYQYVRMPRKLSTMKSPAGFSPEKEV